MIPSTKACRWPPPTRSAELFPHQHFIPHADLVSAAHEHMSVSFTSPTASHPRHYCAAEATMGVATFTALHVSRPFLQGRSGLSEAYMAHRVNISYMQHACQAEPQPL